MEIINNKYKVIKKLGTGGAGTVYLVLDENDKEIALKLLNKNFKQSRVRRLKKEFSIMKSLNHENIVEVYDFDYDKSLGSYYFTLEYIYGGNFNSFNRENDSTDILIKSFYQLLKGLNYLHFNNNIHYDLSDNNVLVKIDKKDPANFIIKITDFGLSSKFDSTNDNENEIVGTLDFISPEMYKREDIDHRTDLYSAGMILLNYLDDFKSKFSYLSMQEFSKLDREFDEVLLKKRIFKLSDMRFKKFLLKILEVDPELRISSAKKALIFLNKTFEKNFEIPGLISFDLTNIGISTSSFNKEISDRIISIFNISKYNNGKYIVIKGSEGSGKTRLVNEFKIYNQFIGNSFINFKISDLKSKGTFEEIDQLKFFFKKFLYSLEYDVAGNIDLNIVSKLLLLLKENSFYDKMEYDKFIRIFIDLFKESTRVGNRYVISIENIESADEKLLAFIHFFLNNLYDKLNHFYVITTNPNRISKANSQEVENIIVSTEKNTIIPLKEISIEQIEILFKSYFNGIKNIPKYLYYTLHKFSENNLNRVNYLFKLLFNKEVIVREKNSFVLTSKEKFKKVISEYIAKELVDKKSKLCSNKISVMSYLSLSSIPLSLSQISELTGIEQEKLSFIIADIKVEFFIEEKDKLNLDTESIITYYIDNELIKNIFISLLSPKEIEKLHYNIVLVISIDETRDSKNLYNEITAKYIHSYLGKNRVFLKDDNQLNDFKKKLIKEEFFKEYLKINDSIINSDLEFVSNKDKLLLCYDNIIIIYEKQLEFKIKKYIELFDFYKNSIEDKTVLEVLDFNIEIIKFIAASFSSDLDNFEFERLFKENPAFFDKVENLILEMDNSSSEMKVLIKTSIRFFEMMFEKLDEYKVIFLNFIIFLKKTENFTTEYLYLKLLNTLFVMREYGSKNILLSEKKALLLESKIKYGLDDIIAQNDILYISKSYHIISMYYKSKRVSKHILDFFKEATKYLIDKRYVSLRYDIILNYSIVLENSYLFKNALKAVNSILNKDLNFNFLNEIIKLMYKRVKLKRYLEFGVSELKDELYDIIEYKSNSLEDIKIAYEELIYLHYEKGDFNLLGKLLDKYFFLMNSRKKDSRSIDYFLKYNLHFFKINEIILNFSKYLNKLGISDDEFLDIIIEYKERNSFHKSLLSPFDNISSDKENDSKCSLASNHLLHISTVRLDDDLNSDSVLSNEFILDYVNFFIFFEGKSENEESQRERSKELYLTKIKQCDKESSISIRAKVVNRLLENIDYDNSLRLLYKDIKLLYKKGYLNTSHKYATGIAKFAFYYKKDNKMFLKFAELSLKIVSEIFSNSKKEYRTILEKNEDIVLLKDIIRFIKEKSMS